MYSFKKPIFFDENFHHQEAGSFTIPGRGMLYNSQKEGP